MPGHLPVNAPKSGHVAAGVRPGAYASPGGGDATLIPFNLREALAVIRRHIWLVLGIIAAFVPLALFVASRLAPAFSATAVVRLANARSALTGGLVDGGMGGIGSRSVDPLLSEAEIIAGRAVARQAVENSPALQLDLYDIGFGYLDSVAVAPEVVTDTLELSFGAAQFTVRSRTEEVTASYGTRVSIGGVSFSILSQPESEVGQIVVLPTEIAAVRVMSRVRARPREATDIIDITFTDFDARRAQVAVNRVAQAYQQANALAAQQQSRLQREFLADQLRFSDSVLSAVRAELTAFRSRERVYGANQRFTSEQAGVFSIQMRREELNSERRMYQDLLAPFTAGTDRVDREALRAVVSTPGMTSSVEVSQIYSQLLRHEALHDSLTTGEWAVPESHPDVARLNTMISLTQARLVEAVRSALEAQINSLNARVAALDQLRAQSEATFQELSVDDAEENRLVEQVEGAQRMADRVRDAYDAAQVAEAVEVGQVEILELAMWALPGGPGQLRVATFIMLLGVFLGTGSAFVADRLNTKVKGERDAAALGLPVLGVIPRLRGRSNGLGTKAAGPLIEAVRGIRLNLSHIHGKEGALVLTVTSPDPGDGKSFVASNLALAFAYAGYRTLLIDGDIRKGSLHKVVNRVRRPGLTDLLGGRATRKQVIQPTEYPSLYFMGCGTRTTVAPELLNSHTMWELLSALRESSHKIVTIIDSPPLGAGVDASSLAAATGNLVVVLRLGYTDRAVAEAKLELLEHLPVRVLGAVLNDARKGSSYGYGRQHPHYLSGYELEDEQESETRLLTRGEEIRLG